MKRFILVLALACAIFALPASATPTYAPSVVVSPNPVPLNSYQYTITGCDYKVGGKYGNLYASVYQNGVLEVGPWFITDRVGNFGSAPGCFLLPFGAGADDYSVGVAEVKVTQVIHNQPVVVASFEFSFS